jgi:hypothetical protein
MYKEECAMDLTVFSAAGIGQFLEGGMVFCFGVSWPFAIYRTWKAKRVEGKSLVFLVLVFVGYVFGVASKFFRAAGGKEIEKITILYAINAILVGIDMCLYMRYRKRTAAGNAGGNAIIDTPPGN